jgi:hypothetical protein
MRGEAKRGLVRLGSGGPIPRTIGKRRLADNRTCHDDRRGRQRASAGWLDDLRGATAAVVGGQPHRRFKGRHATAVRLRLWMSAQPVDSSAVALLVKADCAAANRATGTLSGEQLT